MQENHGIHPEVWPKNPATKETSTPTNNIQIHCITSSNHNPTKEINNLRSQPRPLYIRKNPLPNRKIYPICKYKGSQAFRQLSSTSFAFKSIESPATLKTSGSTPLLPSTNACQSVTTCLKVCDTSPHLSQVAKETRGASPTIYTGKTQLRFPRFTWPHSPPHYRLIAAISLMYCPAVDHTRYRRTLQRVDLSFHE